MNLHRNEILWACTVEFIADRVIYLGCTSKMALWHSQPSISCTSWKIATG